MLPQPIDAARDGAARVWAVAAFGLALLVAGFRWALLARFGTDVPYWDEWPAVAARLFEPWVEDRLTWSALAASHNGHRILLTRLWELAFFELNARRWDPLLVQTANAAVFAAGMGLVAFFSGLGARHRHRPLILVAVTAAAVVPFGYSNLLVAFQSSFTFFLLLSAAALGLVSSERPTGRELSLGLGCAALALFTVGAGVLLAITIALIGLLRGRDEPARRRRWLGTAAAAATVAAVGLALGGQMEKSGSFADNVVAAGRYLAWPAGNFLTLLLDWPDSARYLPAGVATWPSEANPWVPSIAAFFHRHPVLASVLPWIPALLLHAPILALLWRTFRARHSASAGFTPALGLWAIANVAAMALARTEYALVPPRYQDILALGLLANALAWLALSVAAPAQPPAMSTPPRLRWPAVTWASLAILCTALTAWRIFKVQLPRKHAENIAAAEIIQAYLETGDERLFQGRPPNHVPWPNREAALARLLDAPAIRGFLPTGVLPAASRPAPSAWSRAAARVRALGWFFALAGTVLLAGALWRLLRDSPPDPA